LLVRFHADAAAVRRFGLLSVRERNGGENESDQSGNEGDFD
jgi:hypothetical protein